MRLSPLLTLLVAAASLACSPSPLPDGERRQVLRAVADVAVETLGELSSCMSELDAAVVAAAESPGPGEVDSAREAFRAARVPWKESLAFAFGPAKDLMSEAAIDQPVDPDRIESTLTATSPLDARAVAALGANRKGLHTLEYLLFRDPEGTTAAAALAADARRRDYARGVSAALVTATDDLERAWAEDGGDFARRFAEPGSAGSVHATTQGALDAIVNECVALADTLANARLAKPLGLKTGGEPDPSLEESPWADASVEDIQAGLRGVRNVYFGTVTGEKGHGIDRLVTSLSPAAAARIAAALELAETRVAAIPKPYRTALASSTATVESAYEAVRDLKRALATEIVGLLGATLQFNDNDGD